MPTETFSSFWNRITSHENFREQSETTVRKLRDMIKESTRIPKMLENLYGFPKILKSLRHPLRKKIRNFWATFHPNRYFTEMFRWLPLTHGKTGVYLRTWPNLKKCRRGFSPTALLK